MANHDIPIGDGAVIALQQDRPGAVGTVEARPRAPLAEVADVPAVLFAKLDLKLGRLARIFLVEPLEGVAVGLAVADVLVLVDGLAVPDQGQLLALERDVKRLPLARAASRGFRAGKARS